MEDEQPTGNPNEPTLQDIYVDRLAGAVCGQILGSCMTGPPPAICGLGLLTTNFAMHDGATTDAVSTCCADMLTLIAHCNGQKGSGQLTSPQTPGTQPSCQPAPPVVQRALAGNPAELLVAAGGSLPFNHLAVMTICCGLLRSEPAVASIAARITADPTALAGAAYCRSVISRIIFGEDLVVDGLPTDWVNETASKTTSLVMSPPGHVRGAVISATFALACIKHAVANSRVPNFTAILRAVDGRGGDTCANRGIVGAILGAYLGLHRLPHDVIKNMIDGVDPNADPDSPPAMVKKLLQVGIAMSIYGANAADLLMGRNARQPSAGPTVVVDTPAAVGTDEPVRVSTPVIAETPVVVDTPAVVVPSTSADSPEVPAIDEPITSLPGEDDNGSLSESLSEESLSEEQTVESLSEESLSEGSSDNGSPSDPITSTLNNSAISAGDPAECPPVSDTVGVEIGDPVESTLGDSLDDILRELNDETTTGAGDTPDTAPGTVPGITPDTSAETGV